MNNTFYFPRFWLLAKKNFRESIKLNLISLLVFAFLAALFLYGNPFTVDPLPADYLTATRQKSVFWILFFPFLTFYAASVFRGAVEKDKAASYFMLPASTFEKYLLSFLNSTVVFFVGYVLVFYAVDALMLFCKPHIAYAGVAGVPVSSLANVFNLNIPDLQKVGMSPSFVLQVMVVVALFVQAFFMLGSVFFKKNAFLFSLLTLLGLNQLCSLLNLAVISITGNGLGAFSHMANSYPFVIFVPDFSWGQCALWCLTLLPVLLWVSSFLRLKEKHV